MLRRTTLLAATIGTIMAAAPLAAQSVDDDARCALASNVFSKVEKAPAKKQLATLASFFYLGRLDGRLSPAQIRSALLAQGKLMKQADLGTTMTACAKRLQATNTALQGPAAQAQPGAPKGK